MDTPVGKCETPISGTRVSSSKPSIPGVTFRPASPPSSPEGPALSAPGKVISALSPIPFASALTPSSLSFVLSIWATFTSSITCSGSSTLIKLITFAAYDLLIASIFAMVSSLFSVPFRSNESPACSTRISLSGASAFTCSLSSSRSPNTTTSKKVRFPSSSHVISVVVPIFLPFRSSSVGDISTRVAMFGSESDTLFASSFSVNTVPCPTVTSTGMAARAVPEKSRTISNAINGVLFISPPPF